MTTASGLQSPVLKLFPIGSVILLQTGGEEMRLKPRVAEGAPENGTDREQIILDGQQRTTSLYLALRSRKPVPTRTERARTSSGCSYLDIAACLNPEVDREDAVLWLPPAWCGPTSTATSRWM